MPQLQIPDKQATDIRAEHGSEVLESLHAEVQKKNQTLQWKSSVKECFPRFRAVQEYANDFFVEIGFDAKDRPHRAIFGWLEERDMFVLLTVFEKEERYQSSKQHKIFNQLQRHGDKMIEDLRS